MLNISKIKLEVQRTALRQTLQDNAELISIEEYYKHSTFLPFLYSLLQQLNNFFDDKTKDAIRMYLISSINQTPMSEK